MFPSASSTVDETEPHFLLDVSLPVQIRVLQQHTHTHTVSQLPSLPSLLV